MCKLNLSAVYCEINLFLHTENPYPMRHLILILFVSFTMSAFSQEPILPLGRNEEVIRVIRQLASTQGRLLKIENFTLGVSLNPSISWLQVTHDDLTTDGATLAGSVAVHVDYKLNQHLSVVTGLSLGIQGGYLYDNASMNDLTTKNNFRQNYHIIETPLLLRYTTKQIGQNFYYGQLGLVNGFNVSAREFHTKSSWNYPNKKINITPLSETYFLSWQVGFGTRRPIWNNNSVFAEINFKSAFTNLASEWGYLQAARYTPLPTPRILSGNMFFTFGLNF